MGNVSSLQRAERPLPSTASPVERRRTWFQMPDTRSRTAGSLSWSSRWSPSCPQADQGPPASRGRAGGRGLASFPVDPKPSILVVEDDEDCRTVLTDLLEMSGYSVLSCGEARRAVEMVREHRPALVLVDFMMPDADGGWLVRSLRAEGGSLAAVPVVLTTGSSAGRVN